MCVVKQVKNLFTDLKYKMQADRFVLLYKFEIFFSVSGVAHRLCRRDPRSEFSAAYLK